MNPEYLDIAAHMLNNFDAPASVSFLNPSLVKYLNGISALCGRMEIKLYSDSIAIAIMNWQTLNPHEKAYGE